MPHIISIKKSNRVNIQKVNEQAEHKKFKKKSVKVTAITVTSLTLDADKIPIFCLSSMNRRTKLKRSKVQTMSRCDRSVSSTIELEHVECLTS